MENETKINPEDHVYAIIDGEKYCLTCLVDPILLELDERTDIKQETKDKIRLAIEIKKARRKTWLANIDKKE